MNQGKNDGKMSTSRRGSPGNAPGTLTNKETISAIIQKVCHDIGNPLTSIISLATLIDPKMLGAVPQDKLSGYSTAIQKESWRIARLSDRLAALFAPRPAESRPLPVHGLIDRALQRIYSRVGREDVPVDISGEEDRTQIGGDGEQLLLLFVELLDNALEEAERDPANGGVAVDIETKGDTVRVLIRNKAQSRWTGDLAELFQPLVTGHEDRKAPGLGLTLAAVVCDRFGASLEVIEEEQNGAIFFTAAASFPDRSV